MGDIKRGESENLHFAWTCESYRFTATETLSFFQLQPQIAVTLVCYSPVPFPDKISQPRLTLSVLGWVHLVL
jgi:hypothetical protein